jgi:hypothetical protein
MFTGTAHAASNDYAYAWTIVPDVGGAAYVVELTPEVYAALTTADLRDFDVINAAGDSVPTALYRPAAAAPRNPTVQLPMFTVPAPPSETPSAGSDESIHLHIERGADGRLRSVDAATTPALPTGVGAAQGQAHPPVQLDNRSRIILDASRIHQPLLSLRIDWDNAVDATAHFSISASDDLQSWRTLVGNAAATRLTQDGNTLERHEISLDRAPHTYLMLVRSDNGPALPNLTVSVTTPASAQQPEQRWIAAASDGVDTAATDGVTFLYHLPASLAASGVNVQLVDDNAVARAQLYYEPLLAPKTRVAAASFVAFRLRDGETLLSNDPLRNVITQRAQNWRVAFATPMPHAPTLQIAYTPDRIVFLPQGGQPYRLLAGSAKAHHAEAPIDVALAQLRASNGPDWKPPLIALGARAEAGGAEALVAPKPVVAPAWRTWLLWGVLVAAAAIVGGLALSLLRKH